MTAGREVPGGADLEVEAPGRRRPRGRGDAGSTDLEADGYGQGRTRGPARSVCVDLAGWDRLSHTRPEP
ncbi:hypothetical protein [Rubrivirga sp.]|uniref:hypothetical protein n=1 Tax=Rubrivirga sp. TaxID=1885344 RepID=UPI003C70F67B